jgi:hypothetical protein
MPFISIIVKNLNKYFQFEITILDDKNIKRRFKASNFNKQTRVGHLCCTIPLTLTEGWNHIKFNLDEFTQRAFNTRFVECIEVKLHGNCRLRRIFFSANDYIIDSMDFEYSLVKSSKNDKNNTKIVKNYNTNNNCNTSLCE